MMRVDIGSTYLKREPQLEMLESQN